MGYKSLYRIYAGERCLGTFGGWTADEAIKQAQKEHPTSLITEAVPNGDMSNQGKR